MAANASGSLSLRSGRSFSGVLQIASTQTSQRPVIRKTNRLHDQGRLLPSGKGAQASVATRSQNASFSIQLARVGAIEVSLYSAWVSVMNPRPSRRQLCGVVLLPQA